MIERSKPRHLPPLLQDPREASKRDATLRRPRKQERKVAAAVGGYRQPGSGAFSGHKGDVRKAGGKFPMLIECKRVSGKESIRIELRALAKITGEALAKGMYPALEFQFDDEVVKAVTLSAGGLASTSADWIALPLGVFRGMLEALEGS